MGATYGGIKGGINGDTPKGKPGIIMASNGMVMRPEPHINRLELEINGQE
jgi:hypothetical protein